MCARVYLRVRAETAQVALQISVCHQLHHHQSGLAFRDHTQQPHLISQSESSVRTDDQSELGNSLDICLTM